MNRYLKRVDDGSTAERRRHLVSQQKDEQSRNADERRRDDGETEPYPAFSEGVREDGHRVVVEQVLKSQETQRKLIGHSLSPLSVYSILLR